MPSHRRDDVLAEFREADYGALWSSYYDELTEAAEQSTLDILHAYSGSRPRAIELAIGTGRLALPLKARGVSVRGVDISEEMVSLLRAKPGGADIDVVIGDMTSADLGDQVPLVYLAFNTLFALLTQERQLACFSNAARHLEPGGRFVLDCFVPDIKRYDAHNTRMAVSSITSNQAHAYEMSIHDPLGQTVMSHYVRRLADGTTMVLPLRIRYAWPSEMDLMARLAGLELEARWGWYDRRDFTEASAQHVSVYRRP